MEERKKVLVLCFDGTGNYFTGSDEDTNILKIYRMLDKNDTNQVHYYQPGIGTYVTTSSVSDTSLSHRLKSKIDKMKDAAVGTHLADHVMGGYKFLMANYEPDAEVYVFGFSRGAYTARFLAQMLDEIGLLSLGNEEMRQFAWDLFQQWARRTPEEKQKSIKTRHVMDAFKKTFGQTCRIKFLGCFDTVFSVPRFESAWMSRSKFPYAANTRAKVIRHAVSIDERRAKFRQHLLSSKPKEHPHMQRFLHSISQGSLHTHKPTDGSDKSSWKEKPHQGDSLAAPKPTDGTLSVKNESKKDGEASSVSSSIPDEEGKHNEQPDILEVWFPGCHTDIGGGWGPEPGEPVLLSHVPLVWMVREARRAGLRFNEDMVRELHCHSPKASTMDEENELPEIMIESSPTDSPTDTTTNNLDYQVKRKRPVGDNTEHWHNDDTKENGRLEYSSHLKRACEEGRLHDALEFNWRNGFITGKYGFSIVSALGWNFMEYIPFRRMDLRKDGSWRARRFPLPMGEVRDIPHDALIHRSAIARMETDPNYRPGNLIVGGGGRGRRKAPKKFGTGEWEVRREEGDVVGECFVRSIPKWEGDGKKYPKRHQVHWEGRVWTCRRKHNSKHNRVPGTPTQFWEEVGSPTSHRKDKSG